jgi:type II secretory pathway pseudopilin PulG
MRAIFGVLSLLIVLAIVGSIAKRQLQAFNGGVVTRASNAAAEAQSETPIPGGDRDGATLAIPGGMPGAVAADTSGMTVPQQSQNLQQQVRDRTVRALQQGVDRNARAER